MMLITVMTDDEIARYSAARDRDCSFGALQTPRGCLPLAAMDVDARVTGVIAAIEVAQTFVNTTGGPIEATYIFPLPDRAAVHRFRMQIGAREIEGVVDERGAARETYDRAIAAGHHAAITEEERAGVFTLRVGNLMPGEVATIRLSLVGPLPVDDGEVTFRFPLVVAPRYMPGAGLAGDQAGLGVAADTSLVPDASRISPPVRLPGLANPVRLGLRVAIADPAVGDVASSLHAVTVGARDGKIIEVQPGEALDRDFILRWQAATPELRSALVVADDANGAGGTFMLTMIPPATAALGVKPRDVVFVIDRSGSMQGWKMVAARRAAARMIDSLTSRDRFCTIAFDDVCELVPATGLVAATDRERFRAVEALAKIDARNGTELAAPLAQAVAMLAGGTDDRERVVVLVTDGQVGNEDHILRELAPRLRNVRMFTLGIDQAVNAAFLRRLAGAGGGLCELVESEDRLDVVMAKVHRRIGAPVAIDLDVRGANGLAIDRAQLAPAKLPDVHAGAPLVICGRYTGRAPANAAIAIAGTSLGEPLALTIARDAEPPAGAWLAATWARAHIRDLEDAYAAAPSAAIEHRVVATSKQFGVLSRFTAFVAVDRATIANASGHVTPIVQPVEAPAGWGDSLAGPSANTARGGGGALPTGAFTGGARRLAGKAIVAHAAPVMQAPAAAPAPAPMSTSMSAPVAKREVLAEESEERSLGGAPSGPRRPPSAGRSAPPPPPAQKMPAAGPMTPTPRAAPHDAKVADKPHAAPTSTPYHAKLATLARELEAQAHGRNDASSIRVLRQRLTEWCEDVRSVGAGLDALAAEVERLVAQLTAALAAGAPDARAVLAVAVALAALVTAPIAPTSPTSPTGGRPAFWK